VLQTCTEKHALQHSNDQYGLLLLLLLLLLMLQACPLLLKGSHRCHQMYMETPSLAIHAKYWRRAHHSSGAGG
jgi:hypothetical protein